MTVAPALKLSGVTKTYPGVVALNDASFGVMPGEVHALVGENGAGKSTLMGVASGSTLLDSGSVEIAGEPLRPATPQLAEKLGLAIAYQRPALVPDLTVAENLAYAAPSAIRPRAGRAKRWAGENLARLEVGVAADSYVRDLSVADRQLVEIVRALSIDPKVLVLDEPTEPLVPDDVERLFAQIRRIAAEGAAVVYISHRIPEVKQIADRITVLRDGEVRGTRQASELTEAEIVSLIAGRSVESTFPDKDTRQAEEAPVLAVRGLSGEGFDDVSLKIAAGEVVGLAGIEGNGQRQFIRALAGVEPSRGTVELNGSEVSIRSPRHAADQGIVYASDDRAAEGLFMPSSIVDNLTAASLARDARGGFLSDRRQRRRSREQVESLRVKTPSLDAPAQTLSGGNQQKVVIGRALLAEPRLLLIDHPTQGVDVGSRVDIYQIVRDAARKGLAVLVLSSDAIELEGLCDRVAIFSRGQIAGELDGSELTEEKMIGGALTATSRSAVGAGGSGLPGWRFLPFLRGDFLPAAAIFAISLLAVLYTSSQSSNFLTEQTFLTVFALLAVLVFVSLAQQIVVLAGGIDLSVGPAVSILVVLASFFITPEKVIGYQLVGVAVMLLAAIAIGVANGLLAEWARIPAVIATLVTYILLQGFGFLLRPTPEGTLDPAFTEAIGTTIGPVPVALIVGVAVAIGLDLAIRRTRWGISLRAVGSEPEAAFRLGARVRLVRFSAYVAAGLLIFPAGLLLMGQAGIGSAGVGVGYTLTSITAVVLGGAAIGGGRGAFLGALAGATLIQVITSALPYLQLQEAWNEWLLGGLILLSAILYGLLKRAPRHDLTQSG